jgi:hypothetical protein
MAINSQDALITAITAGQTHRYDWNKITGAAAYTAGRWYDTSSLNGNPVANAYPGTALGWVTCNEAAGNGTQIFGMPHGGDVSTDLKQLLNMYAVTAVATGVPAVLMLCDMQGYWPGINMNTLSAQTMTGTPTLRYTNGEGCRLFLVARATTGSTAHNIAVSYSNTVPTAGRTLPVTVAATASAIVPHIVHSGTAANNYGPFLPLASGDKGVSNVATVTLSAASGSASTAALVLTRPLATLPLTTLGVAAERDLLNQFPSLPTIKDGACLHWLLFTGAAVAANTNFYGAQEVAWG